MGPRAGQKLFTLQTVPPRLAGLEGDPNGAARASGFSLHAGVDIAPHSKLRAAVTPAHRGSGAAKQPVADPARPPTPRHVAMSWARRLKRVFGIEIDSCARCGGKLKIIASIEDPQVIAKILSHLERADRQWHQPELPLGARAPPVQSRLLGLVKEGMGADR